MRLTDAQIFQHSVVIDSDVKAKRGHPRGSRDKPQLPGAPPWGCPKKSAQEVSKHLEPEGESK